MATYRVLHADRTIVPLPSLHVHISAIEMVAEPSAETMPSMAWQVGDVLRETDASYTAGPVVNTVPIVVGVHLCPTCGARVLRVLPEDVERALAVEPH